MCHMELVMRMEIFFALIREGILFLFNYSQIMMVCDTISSRYLSVLTLELYDSLGFDHMPKLDFLKQIYNWGDSVLEELGNDGYSIIKNFESICTGCIIHMFDRLKSGENYLNEIIGSFREESDQMKLRNLTTIILEETIEPNHLIEIFGCYRHFGHPIVNEDEGVKDLISNTRMDIPTDDTIMRQVSGAFNRMFIINCIKKNQRWPLCKISNDYPNSYDGKIIKLINSKPLAITLYDRSIVIEE